MVLSGNISPSKCCLDYCKKESDWLSKNQSEITRCQLTSFSVQKFTGCGENPNHVIISLSSYAICLSFESSSKMDQWYGALERLLGTYGFGNCVFDRALLEPNNASYSMRSV